MFSTPPMPLMISPVLGLSPVMLPAGVVENTASLTWEPVQADDLAGYRVYYGTVSGVYQQTRGTGFVTTEPSYVVRDLTPGQTYYFAVTSFDASGNESAYSTEVSKRI